MILAASTGAQFGTLPITVGLVQTTAPGIGGVDHITTGTGGSIVFGGTAGDVIKTDQELDGTTSTSTDNTNFIFGDDGYITWVGTELDPGHLGAGLNPEGVFHGADTDSSDIDAVVSTDPSDGGNDQITLGAGKAIVVGGQGDDTITGGTGTNIILGDSGMILAASTRRAVRDAADHGRPRRDDRDRGIGGIDHITTGTGGSIVFGGTAGDVIKTDQELDGTTSTSTDNTNFIFGDDGYITWVGTELDPGHPRRRAEPRGRLPRRRRRLERHRRGRLDRSVGRWQRPDHARCGQGDRRRRPGRRHDHRRHRHEHHPRRQRA